MFSSDTLPVPGIEAPGARYGHITFRPIITHVYCSSPTFCPLCTLIQQPSHLTWVIGLCCQCGHTNVEDTETWAEKCRKCLHGMCYGGAEEGCLVREYVLVVPEGMEDEGEAEIWDDLGEEDLREMREEGGAVDDEGEPGWCVVG